MLSHASQPPSNTANSPESGLQSDYQVSGTNHGAVLTGQAAATAAVRAIKAVAGTETGSPGAKDYVVQDDTGHIFHVQEVDRSSTNQQVGFGLEEPRFSDGNPSGQVDVAQPTQIIPFRKEIRAPGGGWFYGGSDQEYEEKQAEKEVSQSADYDMMLQRGSNRGPASHGMGRQGSGSAAALTPFGMPGRQPRRRRQRKDPSEDAFRAFKNYNTRPEDSYDSYMTKEKKNENPLAKTNQLQKFFDPKSCCGGSVTWCCGQ